MNNKGKVTVFLCMILCAIITLVLTTYKTIDINVAKAKVAMNTRTALSCVKAEYNSYIFKHYHILLFDSNKGGKGVGNLEAEMEAIMQANLGDDYSVNEVAIVDLDKIVDDEFFSFKKQIREVVVYLAAEEGVNRVKKYTKGKDGQLSDEIVKDMEDAENSTEESAKKNVDEKSAKKAKKKDPRRFTSAYKGVGIMHLVVPEDTNISDEVIDISKTMSGRYGITFFAGRKANMKFDKYGDLKKDLKHQATWGQMLLDSGEGVAYAGAVFNNALNQNINTDAVLACEQEYIICGKNCDYENLKSVVNRLVAIRFPIDFAYLVKDTVKMAQISEIAWPLSAVTFIPEPILKYLLAGCWSYSEAIAEVRLLLHGKKIEMMKSSKNWLTDIDSLSDSVVSDNNGADKGMDYQDYLYILLAMEKNKIYFRMLDLMELNVRQYNDKFFIDDCAVGVEVDVDVDYQGQKIYINEKGEY